MSNTVQDKIAELTQIKTDIRTAILSKGVDINEYTPFTDYPSKVAAITDPATPSEAVATGNPVSIKTNKRQNAENVKISFSPKQSGSGTPSPTNIRPISGYNSLSLSQKGINLINLNDMQKFSNWSSTIAPNGNMASSTGNRIFDLPALTTGVTYTLSIEFNYNTFPSYLYFGYRINDTATRTDYITTTSVIKKIITFTAEEGVTYCFRMSNLSSEANLFKHISKIKSIQLEVGEKATDHETYLNNNFTINLGDTYYDGVLDATTGTLTVTHTISIIDENLDGGVAAIGGLWFVNNLSLTEGGSGLSISNSFKAKGTAYTNTQDFKNNTVVGDFAGCSFSQNQYRVFFRDERFANNDELKAYLSENPVYVVQELAEPITISLAPLAVALLKGRNQLSTNGDEIEITYSPKKEYPFSNIDIDNTNIAEKISILAQVKDALKDEINNLGVTVLDSDPFVDYSLKIDSALNEAEVFEFHVDSNIGNPECAVTYLGKNFNYTPVGIVLQEDKTTYTFDYGSWANTWIINDIKPCILNPSGQVVCYLNPNDYTKDINGNTVPITQAEMDADSTSPYYLGNVMVEFPKIWIKIVPDIDDVTSATIYISNQKVDNDYIPDYAYIDPTGVHKDHFYMPAYIGSDDGTRIRSVSGGTPKVKITSANARAACEANGIGWHMDLYSQRMIVNWLLVLLGKNINVQEAFGYGATGNGTEALVGSYQTGVTNTFGQFNGTKTYDIVDPVNTVKVFGMENYWGVCNHWMDGIINNSYNWFIKLCYGTEDGSTVNGFSNTGIGYVNPGFGLIAANPSSVGSELQSMNFSAGYGIPQDRIWPTPSIQDDYYSDGFYSFHPDNPSSSNRFCTIGGSSTVKSGGGPFCFAFDPMPTDASQWKIGVAPSYT